MIWLYAAVDDADAAVASFDKSAKRDLAVLQAGSEASGHVVPCIGRWTEDPLVEWSEEAVCAHSDAVQRMLAVCTVVPFRFRRLVSSVDDFHHELDGHASELAELLAWLRGRVELAVRARCSDAPAHEPAGSGRSYLINLRDPVIPPSLAELHHILLSTAVAATAVADDTCGMKGSYLVERGDVDDFCKMAKAALSDLPDITGLSVTGPWAPYSFVTSEWARTDGRQRLTVGGGHD